MRRMHSSDCNIQTPGIVLSVLITLGIVFAVYYGNVFANDTEETMYLCFTILAALEAVFSSCSLVLRLKAKKGVWVNTVYILSGILCIPVTLFAMVWLLHWIGFDLLPPPQQ